MKKTRIKWFVIGFLSCLFCIIAFVAYGIFYSNTSFQVDLQTNSISLPNGEILVYTHDSCTEKEKGAGEHVLTLIKNDGTWESHILNSNFSDFPTFILATSINKELVWAIDPVNQNWIEWNMKTNRINEHLNELPPTFDRSRQYVRIDK